MTIIIKSYDDPNGNHITVQIEIIGHSSVLMRFLCKTSHKDSCAWPCLTWHCQPIIPAEYNQWSPLLRLL